MEGYDFGVKEGIFETFLDPTVFRVVGKGKLAEESLMTSFSVRNFTLPVSTGHRILEALKPIPWYTLRGEVETSLDLQGSQIQSIGTIKVLNRMQ